MAEALYSREQVERWQKSLEEISQEPRSTFTKKQAVEELIDTIEKALSTRSYDEVASGLKEWGLDISAGSLKQYVTRYRRSHSLKTSAGNRKRSGKSTKEKSATGAATKADSTATMTEASNGKSVASKDERTKSSRFIEMAEDL